MAAALDVENGTIRSARIGLTGASSHATRLTDVEEALAGKPLSASSIEAAARLAGASLQDINSDIHASEEYRRAMIPVFTGRALKRALERGSLTRLQLRLQAREEAIQHHLRHAADQPLADARDRTAGVDGPAHVHRRGVAVGSKRDRPSCLSRTPAVPVLPPPDGTTCAESCP